MIRRSKCTCGARYETFRTGLTYGGVYAMLLAGPDPDFWRDKSRPAVMRFWAQYKRDLWDQAHGYCPDTFDVSATPHGDLVPGNLISFRTQAGAKAFARARARAEGRPVKVDVRAGETVLEAWEGDWRGRVRRAA
jgi:hypothetical protein